MTIYKKCEICGFSLPQDRGKGAVGTKHYKIEHDNHKAFCKAYILRNPVKILNTILEGFKED